MGQVQESRRLYNAFIGSGNIRYNTLPDGAAAVTVTAGAVAWALGAWVQIAATIGAANGWLSAIAADTPSNPGTDYDIDVGSGAAAAEVSLAEVPYMAPVLWLQFAIRIVAGTRVAARARSASAIADTLRVKIIFITGL